MASSDSEPSDRIEQASAVPFRRRSGRIEFCLITSMSGKRWGFPKGIIELGDTAESTALQEAREEAGLHGDIVGPPLGTYQYRKWGADIDVAVYLMQVSRADATWDEADSRERIWLSGDEARELLDREPLQHLLQTAIDRLA